MSSDSPPPRRDQYWEVHDDMFMKYRNADDEQGRDLRLLLAILRDLLNERP